LPGDEESAGTPAFYGAVPAPLAISIISSPSTVPPLAT
jgi:hypothetical protein